VIAHAAGRVDRSVELEQQGLGSPKVKPPVNPAVNLLRRVLLRGSAHGLDVDNLRRNAKRAEGQQNEKNALHKAKNT
jgi:hypothetical protein